MAAFLSLISPQRFGFQMAFKKDEMGAQYKNNNNQGNKFEAQGTYLHENNATNALSALFSIILSHFDPQGGELGCSLYAPPPLSLLYLISSTTSSFLNTNLHPPLLYLYSPLSNLH
jgi:hypothetical protein